MHIDELDKKGFISILNLHIRNIKFGQRVIIWTVIMINKMFSVSLNWKSFLQDNVTKCQLHVKCCHVKSQKGQNILEQTCLELS